MDAQADAGRLTALHGAAAMGHVEAIAALVGAGAALEARDKKQRTPLHLAAEHGRAAALKALLGAGAALFNAPRGGRRAEPRCAKAHDVRSFHPGQAQTADGSWHGVPSRAGALLVNAGDLIQVWTNDRWRSPPHRVVNP